MKVAILAHERYPIAPPFAGGLESFTWHLVRGLRDRGVEVVLFAGPGSDPALEAEELPVMQFELSDAARADVAMPPMSQVATTMAYANALRSIAARSDVDIVHNNSLHYLPIVLDGTIPQPVVTTLHTPPHPWIEPALRLNPGARTIAVSQWVARRWRSITPSEVIPNGIDLSSWPAGPGGDALVWYGRIVPEKAPHRAALIARRAGMPLHIAGPLVDTAYFRGTLKPLLGNDIRYEGHLGPDALPKLVGRSAACLVTPEWDEPYGLVAAEAMSCGTPVLSFARGGLTEFVRPPGGECIPPDASLDEAVVALQRVTRLNRAAVRRHARDNCALDAMIGRYIELYRSLL